MSVDIGFSSACFSSVGFIVLELIVVLSAMESTCVSVCRNATSAKPN